MWIMNRSVIFLLLVLMFSMTSCDFMRRMAGRPTSNELEMLKGEIDRIELLRREEARVKASLDSLEQAKKAVQDSIADARKQTAVPDYAQYITKNLENRFYVIIGAFQSYENAKVLMNKAERYGYSPSLIMCRNGLIGVAVCPVDKYEDAVCALKILRKEKFCPSDIWIYTNN